MRGIRGRLPLSFSLAVAALLVFGAAQAFAATEVALNESQFGSGLTIFDATNDDDVITVSQDGTNIIVTDTGTGGATAVAPCVQVNLTTVSCPLDPPGPAAPVVFVALQMGAGTDSFTNQNLDADVSENDFGATGNKTVTSGPGNDFIDVGTGNDTIDTGPGFDTVFTDDGGDSITTGTDGDFAEAGQGSDVLDMGEGNDSIGEDDVANGADVLNGGPGIDDFVAYDGGPTNPVTVTLNDQADDGHAGEGDNVLGTEGMNGTEGPDTLVGNDGGNNIFGEDGNDQISGLGGSDGIGGGDGDDATDGGDGNDTFSAGSDADGADAMNGGPGSDFIDYCCGLDPVNVTLNGQADDGRPGEGDNLASFEGVEGGDGPDSVTLDAASNHLDGNGGNDLLVGNGGGDDYFAGRGDDTVVSSGGSSIARGAALERALATRDKLQCDLGFDTVAADARDVVGGDCERRGAEVVSDSAAVNRKGKAKIRLSCPEEEGAPCNGKLALILNGKSIGKGKYKVDNGARKNATAKLSKKGRKALAKNRSLLVSAEARTNEPPGVTANAEDVLLTRAKKGGKR